MGEKTLDADHPVLAKYYNNLALLYKSQEKYEEAEPLLKRAIRIVEKALPNDHPQLANHYKNYSLFLHDLNREEEAAKYEAKARDIRERRGEG